MQRSIDRRYQDPLDRVWIASAESMGLSIVRSDAVYASVVDGAILTLGAAETLDADDSVAQMIFHELCHALVQCGDDESAWMRRDWGLDNRSERDAPRERATLRLQATLAERHGLREFFAPTTEYRAFFDALPADPLADAPPPELGLALDGLRRARGRPFSPHLDDALVATATIVKAAAPFRCRGIASLYDPC
jgi:predicted aminopeptidase